MARRDRRSLELRWFLYTLEYVSESAHPMDRVAALEQAFVVKVFGWMFFALLITAGTAAMVAGSKTWTTAILGNNLIFISAIVAELILVIALSAFINRMSAAVATGAFLVYAAVNGLTLSFVFVAYSLGTVGTAFAISAGVFGTTGLYGYLTKADLTGVGSLCIMGLIGIILASIVNLFTASTGLDWIISYAGVAIFIGLTAYDTQKIKQMSSVESSGEELARKAAISGALALYLDFINLFLYILRIIGRRR